VKNGGCGFGGVGGGGGKHCEGSFVTPRPKNGHQKRGGGRDVEKKVPGRKKFYQMDYAGARGLGPVAQIRGEIWVRRGFGGGDE